MNKRTAKRMGFDVGFGIAEQNFRGLLLAYLQQGSDEYETFGEYLIGETCRIESDHYRQFSPFEFTANEFNTSRDPDGIWEAYDSGVYNGAKAALVKNMKDFVG